MSTAMGARPVSRIVLEAGVIGLLCSGLGVAFNALRPGGIPLVARAEYEILVPCPEPGGEAEALSTGDPALIDEHTFVVDARPAEHVSQWRFRDAMSVPYDYLAPTPPRILRDLARAIARSRAQRVVVYGDGDDPDSGEQLAREISGHGIRNVGFVIGGAPALRDADQAREP